MNKSGHKSIRQKLFVLLQYATILSAVYASATPIASLHYTETVIVFFCFSFTLLLVSMCKGKLLIKKSGVKEAALIIAIIFCSAVFNFDKDISFYLGITVLILGAYFITVSMDYQMYENVMVKTFVAISIISTIITIYLNIYHAYTLHLPRLVTETRSGTVSWGNFYFIYFVWDYWGRFGFIRNSACFREPGVWGGFCSLVLGIKILEIKKRNNKSKSDIFQIVILSIGTLTSFSTSAIICYIICILMLFYNGKRINKKSLFFGVCLFIAIIGVILNCQDVLFGKFVSGTSEYKAYGDRMAGISNSIKAFLTNPLFGAGYTNYYTILQGLPLTVAFVVILGEFGVFGLSWFCRHLVSFSKMISSRYYDFILIVLLISILLLSQNISFSPLYLVLCLYASSYKLHKKRMRNANGYISQADFRNK